MKTNQTEIKKTMATSDDILFFLQGKFRITAMELGRLINRPLPFRVSYHGDSTIILDDAGEWVTQQVPRNHAEEIAREMTNYIQAIRPPF